MGYNDLEVMVFITIAKKLNPGHLPLTHTNSISYIGRIELAYKQSTKLLLQHLFNLSCYTFSIQLTCHTALSRCMLAILSN